MEKRGRAKYVSHLDLMRTMSRAFTRAGIDLRHSEGFNPHPIMSFALPLSVGQESVCELLDFDPIVAIPVPERDDEAHEHVHDENCDHDHDHGNALHIPSASPEVVATLNAALPEGLRVKQIYVPTRKFAQIKWIEIVGALYYDRGVPEHGTDAIADMFCDEEIIIRKRTKRGEGDVDIAPAISEINFAENDRAIAFRAMISAQEPTLNPTAIATAIARIPPLAPDFAEYLRCELYDADMNIFR